MGALAGGMLQGFAQGKTQAQEQKAAKELRDIQVKIYKSQLEAEEKKSQALQKFSAQPPLNPQSGAIAAPMQNAGQMPAAAGDIPGMLASGQINYGDLSAIGANPIEVTKMIAEMQAQKEQRELMAPFMQMLKGAAPQGGAPSGGGMALPNFGGMRPSFSIGPNGPSLSFAPGTPQKPMEVGGKLVGPRSDGTWGVIYADPAAGQGAPVDPWKGIDIPTGYAPVDPANPSAGIAPLQGYTPSSEAATNKGKPFEEVEAEANYSIKLLDELVTHPGMSAVVGAPNPFLAWTPGTDAAGFKARLKQIQGTQFLQAFETLKGGGQITQVEGEKAQAAIARMDASQSEEDFKAAAEEFKGVIEAGLARARKREGKEPTTDKPADLSAAQQIRQAYKEGKISKEEARKQLMAVM